LILKVNKYACRKKVPNNIPKSGKPKQPRLPWGQVPYLLLKKAKPGFLNPGLVQNFLMPVDKLLHKSIDKA